MLIACAFSQGRGTLPPFPGKLLIGRHTYFDFGPPLDYYELFWLQATTNACAIERITVTPEGAPCWQPPTVRVAAGKIEGTMAGLLGKNPCLIPDKELRREEERCKHCLRFSGAEVIMQVQCGKELRRIRMDVLDRDLFDPNPKTPAHTSWTMSLLGRLDETLGDGVMERPIFSWDELRPMPEGHPDRIVADIREGKYDGFFANAPDKLSQLAHDSLIPPPTPTVELVSSEPFRPIAFVPPTYSALAKAARVEGDVRFTVSVNADGSTRDFQLLSKHPLLRGTVEEMAARWQFPKEAAGQEIQAVLRFQTNCRVPHP
jgi:hypothetical protein